MDTLKGWMKHSASMARARLKHPMPGDDLEALTHEARVRDFVLTRIPARLRGEARVWFDYMQAHALLQMQRYGGQMSEADFSRACKRLRDKRDEAIRECAGMPWYSED